MDHLGKASHTQKIASVGVLKEYRRKVVVFRVWYISLLGMQSKTLQTEWLKEQTFISYSSVGWQVQGQGASQLGF